MCGICGFNWNDEELVTRMADEMTHRGPDQHGVYCTESVSLGHRRLSIIDLSENGRQPMFSEDRSVCLIFNGEIYNFRELREELVGKGHTFASRADSEVIIHALNSRLFSRIRQRSCFPSGEQTSSGSQGLHPAMSNTIRHSPQVKPPSSDTHCATTFDFCSFVSFGRRMLLIANSRLPPSTGTIAQNGISHFKPFDSIGVQILPPSSE